MECRLEGHYGARKRIEVVVDWVVIHGLCLSSGLIRLRILVLFLVQ